MRIVKDKQGNVIGRVGESNQFLGATRSLSQLEDEIREIGLELPEAGYGKRELMEMLKQYYWAKKHPDEPLPEFINPMLIDNIKHLPEERQDEIWEDPNWALEIKRNGVRAVGYLGEDPHYNSRNVSVLDFLPESLTKQLFWLPPLPGYDGTVVDGEVISTTAKIDTREFTKGKGTITEDVLQAAVACLMVERSEDCQRAHNLPLRYVLYDIPRYKGENIKNKPYKERRVYLEEVFVAWQKEFPNAELLILNDSITTEKRQFFEQCVESGLEGCVTKWIEGIYKEGPTRTHEQYKIKRQTEVDAVVSGFVPPKSGRLVKEGLVGGLTFSAKDRTDGQWYRVASVSNLDWDFRREISIQNEDGTFKEIKQECYEWVFEIEGQDWNKNGLLTHAKIARPRYLPGPDHKEKEEATFDRQGVLEHRQIQHA